jgi:hypothetical protein
MLRTFILSSLLSTLLFSATNYTVKIAVFGKQERLQKSIDRLSPALRKTVRTYKNRNLVYAYTIPTTDRETLKKLLPAYRKVFHDAYIAPTKRVD